MKTEPYAQVIKPMLAFPFEERKFKGLHAIQPKLDGVRGLYQNGKFVSRDGKVWNDRVVSHITKELNQNIPEGVVLDTEFYIHGLKLQDINKRVAVNRTEAHPDGISVSCHVFDVVHPSLDFLSRCAPFWESWYVPEWKHVKVVPTHIAAFSKHADHLYNGYRRLGYEGIMYRNLVDPYSVPWNCTRKDNRSWSLMKRKGGFDLNYCQILGVYPGEGKYTNSCGYLEIMHGEVPRPFRVGSGLSDMERQFLWDNRDNLYDCFVDIKFDEYSSDHIPLRLRVTILHLNDSLADELV